MTLRETMKSGLFPFVIGAATAFTAIALPSSASAMSELVKYPNVIGSPAISGDDVYVSTLRGSRTVSIERVLSNRKREKVASYLLQKSRSLLLTRFVEYRTSQKSVVALLRRHDGNEFGPEPTTSEALWVGGERGRLRRLPGRPAGLIAADGDHTAAGFVHRGGSVSLKIHTTANGKVRQLRAFSLLELTGARIPENNAFLNVSAIDLQGDLLAISDGSATFIANWRTGTLLRTIHHAGTGVAARVDLIGPVAVTTTHSGGWRSPYNRSTTATNIDTGALLWSSAPLDRTPSSTSDNRLIALSIHGGLHQLDPSSGTTQPFALNPNYLEEQQAVISWHGYDVSASRFVWTEKDCYSTRLLEKQLTEQVSRRRETCPFSFVNRSMRLKGRNFSLVLKAPLGLRRLSVGVRRGQTVVTETGPVDVPLGKHRVRIRLSKRLSAYIRRNKGRPLRVELSPLSHPGSVEVSGRVQVRR